jgi:hypothetical protein
MTKHFDIDDPALLTLLRRTSMIVVVALHGTDPQQWTVAGRYPRGSGLTDRYHFSVGRFLTADAAHAAHIELIAMRQSIRRLSGID